jgi:hypothetical protein
MTGFKFRICLLLAVVAITGCAAGGGIDSGKPDYIPAKSTLGSMTPSQARKVIQHAIDSAGDFSVEKFVGKRLDHYTSEYDKINLAFSPNSIDVNDNGTKAHLWLYGLQSPQAYCAISCVIVLSNNWAIEYAAYGTTFPGASEYQMRQTIQLSDAIYVLEHAANDAEERDQAKFKASLIDYQRMIAAGSTLPQEADMHRVQAESAVRSKQFYDAIDLYNKAVDVAPWWPQGYFNLALMFEATQEYPMAIREMHRYLLLVPNATNAKAAQDKIYIWQRYADQPISLNK